MPRAHMSGDDGAILQVGGRRETKEPIVMVTKPFTSLLCLIFLSGCEKQDSNRPATQNVETPPSAKREARTYQECDIDQRIKILDALIVDFQALRAQFRDATEPNVSAFLNPIQQTLAALEHYKSAYEGFGLMFPAGTWEESEIAYEEEKESRVARGDAAYLTFTSVRYWDDLKDALKTYGYLESGRLRALKNVNLIAKQVFKDSFPPDVFLIADGSFKGFFVKGNGDLLVPGAKLYRDVLETRVRVESWATTPWYYKSQYDLAMSYLEREQYSEGIEALNALLKHLMAPTEIRAEVLYNLGVAHEHKGSRPSALSYYDASIQADPGMAAAYYMRGRLRYAMAKPPTFGAAYRVEISSETKLLSEALDDFQNALRLERDPGKIATIKKAIKLCQDDMAAWRARKPQPGLPETRPTSVLRVPPIVEEVLRNYNPKVSPLSGKPVEDWEKTLRLDPANMRDQLIVGHMYHTESLYKGAIEHYIKAANMNPDVGDPLIGLAQIYHRLANFERIQPQLSPESRRAAAKREKDLLVETKTLLERVKALLSQGKNVTWFEPYDVGKTLEEIDLRLLELDKMRYRNGEEP